MSGTRVHSIENVENLEEKYPCPQILDKNLAKLELVTPKPLALRWDLIPFISVYVVLYLTHITYENEPLGLLAMVGLPIWLFIHLLVLMCEYWIIKFRIFMAYNRIPITNLTELVRQPESLRTVYATCKRIADEEYNEMLKSYKASMQRHLNAKADMQRKMNEAKDPMQLQRQRQAMKLMETLGFNAKPHKPTRPKTRVLLPVSSGASPSHIYVHIVPIEHHGSATLCPLVFNDDSLPPEYVPPFMFEFHHFSYVFNHSVPTAHKQSPSSTNEKKDEERDNEDTGVRSRRTRDTTEAKAASSKVTLLDDYDFAAEPCFTPLLYPDSLPLTEYIAARGLDGTEKVAQKQKLYGPNSFDIPPPTFSTLFVQHAMAPFFVFQVFCVTLWMLDEYWYYSLFTLCMLVLFESMVVGRRISQFKDIISMRPPPAPVHAYRDGVWKVILNDELVPGDIVSITRAAAPLDASTKMKKLVDNLRDKKEREGLEDKTDEDANEATQDSTSTANASSSSSQSNASSNTKFDRVCPCDVLLLEGSCVVNEAMLTGESVPQLKEGLAEGILDDLRESGSGPQSVPRLDMAKIHKRHIVYGGTKVLMVDHVSGAVGAETIAGEDSELPAKPASIPPCPDGGLSAYVLRTGFGSFQGGLVRTILLSTEANAIDVEALAFIGCMMVFAIASAYYVFVEGLKDESRSRYKLLLNCIMIITSVVPPELPMEMSLAVNNSMMALVKLQIFCTEPFRILTAGAVDVCCFDKTGTLTADEFILKGIAGISSDSSKSDLAASQKLVPARSTSVETRIILGACHELALVSGPGGGLVGDPMEREVFEQAGFEFASGGSRGASRQQTGTVVYGQQGQIRLIIQHRFPFSSSKKRMAAIVAVDAAPGISSSSTTRTVYSVVKGAPEVLESRFVSLPKDYTATHRYFACQGCRVLALGWRDVTNLVQTGASTVSRDDAESQLKFGGFLVLQSPLKKDSAEVIEHLQESSHRIIMITGDHVLTACHVANELKISTKPVVILTHADNEPGTLAWRAFDPEETLVAPFDTSVDPESLKKFASQYDLCISGDVLQYLLNESPQVAAAAAKRFNAAAQDVSLSQRGQIVSELYRYASVFARTMPDQKEHILAWLKRMGYGTLMCGDGTNDVGALKQADIGIALLSSDVAAAEDERKKARQQQVQKYQLEAQANAHLPREERLKRELERAREALKEMDEEPSVRLGDASIAAPFTAKHSSVSVTTSVIRQGRATLVTTLQLFQILALNSLISAYSLSVLYLEGVKYGEAQLTIASAAVSMYFFFMSRAEPIERLSAERPHTRVFSKWMISTVLGQFAIHLACLMYAVNMASPYAPDPEHRNPEGKFAPNVLNSTVYLVSTAMTVACFLANYRGRPFMPSLKENNTLYKGLLAGVLYVVVLASDMVPELNEYLELAPFPTPEYRNTVLLLVVGDILLTVGLGRFLTHYFAIIPKKSN